MANNQTQINSIADQLKGIQDRIATEGITDNSGKTLVSPTIPADTLNSNNSIINVPQKTDNTSDWISAYNIANGVNNSFNQAQNQDSTTNLFNQYLNSSAQLAENKKSSVELFNEANRLSGLDTATKNYNTEKAKLDALNAQLTGITNAGVANQLKAESAAAGKDVTGTYLGKEQQEISRQAAIQALPLQAQIQAQQAVVSGNQSLMQTAQSTLNTYFGLLSQDAKDEYDYKKGLLDSVYNFASTQEKAKLDKIAKQEDRDYEEKQNNIKAINSYVAQAISYGQGDLIGKLTSLDPSSPTFQSDLGNVIGNLKDPNAALDTYLKQLQDLSGGNETLSIDDAKKYNELYPNAGIKVGDTVQEANRKAGISGGATNAEVQTLQTKLDNINDILNSPGLGLAVGLTPLNRYPTGLDITGNKLNFIASVNQLIGQETLSTLLNLKKAGGTLGAISEKELEILQNSASKINNWAIKDKNGNVTGYRINEKSFKEELNKIKSSTQKMLDAAKPSSQLSTDGYLDNVSGWLNENSFENLLNQNGY